MLIKNIGANGVPVGASTFGYRLVGSLVGVGFRVIQEAQVLIFRNRARCGVEANRCVFAFEIIDSNGVWFSVLVAGNVDIEDIVFDG